MMRRHSMMKRWVCGAQMTFKGAGMSELETSEAWVSELKRSCGVPDTDVGIEWQGQAFCFVPVSTLEPGNLTVFVWVGPRSMVDSVDTMCQLMWLQLQAVGPTPPVLGFEPDSGQLVIAQCINWQEVSPPNALIIMGFLADLAIEARAVLSGKKKSSQAGDIARKSISMRRELPRGCLVQINRV
jgi:hypothetical protein